MRCCPAGPLCDCVLAMPPAARMKPDEKRVARDMHARGYIPKHIAEHLGRERSTITRLLAKKGGRDPRCGRPPAFSDAQVAPMLSSFRLHVIGRWP